MNLQEAIQTIAKNFPRTLIVGGFVRDQLLGVESQDADLEVYGVPADQLAEKLRELFPGQVIEAGKSFGVLKIPLGDGQEIDVTIPRRESKSGKGHTGFVIEGDPQMSIEEAARRRDFTINAMMKDPLTNELIDLFGGQEDLKNNILRVVDEHTFQDDPLRVYRALQFVARLDLKVEEKTFALMKKMVERGDLSELSKERVSEEMKKLFLKAEKPSRGLQFAFDLGMIERDYPELFILKQTPQEPLWHPEGDVWIHTLMVVDEAAKIIRREDLTENEKLQVVVGALCHDLGKPATTKMGEKEGVPRIRSIGHEEAGEEPTKQLLNKWMFGFEVEQAAIVQATQHLKPGMLFRQKEKGELNEESYTNAVRKLLKRAYPVSWKVIIAAAEADHRGRDLPEVKEPVYPAGELFVKTILSQKFDQEPIKPLVQGRDLIERGVPPGIKMGELLQKIEAARDEGKIKTREEALALLDDDLSKM
ncbi:HD domain-containing protein [Candidatus Uhrbacteria bacterium]|nr:HD domain-containing protein [Candidatus Uhrbacteria bacterium]